MDKSHESYPYYMPDGHRECVSPKNRVLHDKKGDVQPDEVFLDPDDPYCFPSMCPGPEFGCVHHKEKLP